MKHIFSIFGLCLIILSLVSCQTEPVTPNPNIITEIQLEFNPETLEISSTDNRLFISMIDKGNHLEVSVTTTDPFVFDSNLVFKVGPNIILKSLYTMSSKDINYHLPHPNPIDPNSYVSVEVLLDPNGGYWDQSVIDVLEPAATLVISSFNDTTGLTFSLFDDSRTTLRWFYKLFLAYDESLAAYQVVYADPSTASIANLVLPDYDYVIGVHLHTVDAVARETIISWSQDFISPMLVRFSADLTTYESVPIEAYFYLNSQLTSQVNITYLETEDLPVPKRDHYNFLGWSDGEKNYFSFPRYQAKEGIRSVTYTALWQGATLMQLNDYLSSQIPGIAENHIVLPLKYGGFDIVWESSHPEVIDSMGHFKKPYHDTRITLSAIATSESEHEVLTFDIDAEGYKSLAKPIASSYIYRGYSTVSDAFFEILDVINTAFIIAQPDGSLTGNVYLDNVSTYIMPKARIYGNWVIMSVAPESAWSTIAASSQLSETFSDNIVNMINTYGFDGVDIDWETPTPTEATSYTQLMKIVYQKVKANNPNHLVTTAITGGMWQPPRYDLLNSLQYIDYINMMTYGMVTSGAQYQNALYPSSTYHHTGFKVGKTLISCSIAESIVIFRDQFSVPLGKIIVGVAFYGIRQTRSFQASTQTWTPWTFAGSVFYTDIALHYLDSSQYIKAYDNTAGVPYIIKNDGTEFISYDNYKSIRDKGFYIEEEQLGGMMFWENGTDNTGTLLEGIRAGLGKT